MLLRGVREVAALANPTEPLAVSQRAFDAARERSAAHAALPRAKRVAERLGVTWRDVLAVAHAPVARQNRLLAMKTLRPMADWLTEGNVRSALRLVAHRLGEDSVTKAAYRAERAKLVAADERRWLHGGSLRMPSDEAIKTRIGSWDAALRLAGLRVTSERGSGLGAAHGKGAPTIVELIQRVWDCHEAQPTEEELRDFARANDIPAPGRRGITYGTEMNKWKEERRTLGLPVPDGPPPLAERPDYTVDVGAARPGERRLQPRGDAEECAAWVQHFLEDLPSGRRCTATAYLEWLRAHPGAPSIKSFNQHGGWAAVRSRAQERIRAGDDAAAPSLRSSPAPRDAQETAE